MSEWVYRRTCQLLGHMGYRDGEAEGMAQHERSRIFPQVLHADRDGPVTVDRIASDLALPPDDVHALTLGTELRVVSEDEPTVQQAYVFPPSGTAKRSHLRAV